MTFNKETILSWFAILTCVVTLLTHGLVIGQQRNRDEDQNKQIASLVNRERATYKILAILLASGSPFRLKDSERQWDKSLENFQNGEEFWLEKPDHEEPDLVALERYLSHLDNQ